MIIFPFDLIIMFYCHYVRSNDLKIIHIYVLSVQISKFDIRS